MTYDNDNAYHIIPPTITPAYWHIASAQCPCQPELVSEDRNGTELWKHTREV